MKISIEGVDYDIPSSLTELTLWDRIEFDRQYGQDLTKQLIKISGMKDGFEREMEFTDYHMRLACRTLAFFGKIPLDVIEQTNLGEVLAVYHNQMQQFTEEINFSDPEFLMKKEFEWRGSTWNVAPPELKQESVITFEEFLDSKQVVQNMFELGQEKWASLLPLCCIYLRKEGEKYDTNFITEGNERYELMKTLPFDIALHVGFFLKSSMHSFLQTSLFSGKVKPGATIET